MPTIQRETDDWLAWPITQAGSTYLGQWSYQIVPWRSRPTGSWLPAVTVGAAKGIEVAGLTPGYYSVFVRIDGQGSYVPVADPDVLTVL